MHCTRANSRPSERATARASVVLPTPGRSSIRMWPSASSATTTSSTTSAAHLDDGAHAVGDAASQRARGGDLGARDGPDGRARIAVRRHGVPAAAGRAEVVHRREDRPRDVRLRGARDVLLGARRHDRDLVLECVEADAGAADVVDDDRVEALAPQLLAAVVERAVAVLGREADDHLARAPGGGERREHVRRRLELDRQPVAPVLLELAAGRVRGREVRDRRGHEQDVAVREGARGRPRAARPPSRRRGS